MSRADRISIRRGEVVELVTSLRSRLDGILEASSWTAHDDEHDPEGVTIAFERAQVAGLLALATEELQALDAATARIAAGTYGVCARCDLPIGPERLEALPATTTCIRCASAKTR
jgi:RNA polymerase-binding transcription factor